MSDPATTSVYQNCHFREEQESLWAPRTAPTTSSQRWLVSEKLPAPGNCAVCNTRTHSMELKPELVLVWENIALSEGLF